MYYLNIVLIFHGNIVSNSGFRFTVDIATGLQTVSDLVNQDDQLLSEQLASLDLSQRNAVADLIRNLLEGLRVIVIYGNDILPPLDPLHIPALGPVQFSTTG